MNTTADYDELIARIREMNWPQFLLIDAFVRYLLFKEWMQETIRRVVSR